MHVQDIFKYGHGHILGALEGLPETAWETAGPTTNWSIKDVMSHLASFELVLVDVLNSLLDPSAATPVLDQFNDPKGTFKEGEVEKRRGDGPHNVVKEYEAAHEQAAILLSKIPAELLTKTGSLAWYGADYDLEDLIVYMFYGHKEEHMGHIQQYRKRAGI